MIHTASAGAACSCRAMLGKAMLATAESSTDTVMPIAIASIDQ